MLHRDISLWKGAMYYLVVSLLRWHHSLSGIFHSVLDLAKLYNFKMMASNFYKVKQNNIMASLHMQLVAFLFHLNI